MPEFYMIFVQKILFPNFGEQFPAPKLRVSGLDPNTNYDHHGGHRSTGAIVLNKLFMSLLTLLHSISLDA